MAALMVREKLIILEAVMSEKGWFETTGFRSKHPQVSGDVGNYLHQLGTGKYIERKKTNGGNNRWKLLDKGRQKYKSEIEAAPIEDHPRSADVNHKQREGLVQHHKDKVNGVKAPRKYRKKEVVEPAEPALNISVTAESVIGGIGQLVEENARYRKALESMKSTIEGLLNG